MAKIRFALENFSFAFSSSSPLFFDNLSIAIDNPGLTCIVGKNGVGKSTLFRLLQGIVYSDERVSGVLHINDRSYDLSSDVDRKRLYQKSMVLHQNFDSMLAPHFTGFENLRFAQFATCPNLSLVHVTERVGQDEQLFALPLDKPVHFLSGGQRQMLAMLMIAQKELDLLLLDEPIAALDDANSDYVMQGVVKITEKRNLAVLCILHDHDIVQKYARNLIKISQTEAGARIFEIK